jgi:hypothetical protein
LFRKPPLIRRRDVMLDHFPAAVPSNGTDLLRRASCFRQSNGRILAEPMRRVSLGTDSS